MTKNGDLLGKDKLLSGLFNRRPEKLLETIEARCAYIKMETWRAVEAYFLSDAQDFSQLIGLGTFPSLDLRFVKTSSVTLNDLDLYAPYWQALAPPEPELKAAVLHLLAEKYSLTRENSPNIRAVLGVDDPDVQAAYQQAYDAELADLFPPQEPHETGGESSRPYTLEDAMSGVEWLHLVDGEVLFRQGDPGDALYILISGRLRSVVPAEEGSLAGLEDEEGERTLSEFGRGEMVGEVDIFTGEARSTTVYAIRDSELIKLCQEDLYRLAERFPQVMLRINQILASRLRHHLVAPRSPASTQMTFAVIPSRASSPASQPAPERSPLSRFARRLVEALSAYGSVLHLTSSLVDEILGEGSAQLDFADAQSSRLSAWLSEQESAYHYLVYEADAGASDWTRRCVRQADRALVVAEADGNPAPGSVEKDLYSGRVTAFPDLVLLQPENILRPSGTRDWLAPRKIHNHYHIRLENDLDMQYLARRLTGRALSLVLSGGGARGFAHIGAHQALQEAGFQVDLIGGTSMGAILGAAYAAGLDHHGLLDLCKQFASPFKLLDLTLPVVSFFSSEKVSDALREIFGDTQIEDLWRPYFCMSSSLTKARSVIHQQGELWRAIRASSAIPGVFAPILVDGELLVDGAVLNNLPLDVMQAYSQGSPMVGVNVFPEVDLVKEYRFGSHVSGWQALLRKLNPLSDDIQAPWIFENILRVISLNEVHQAKSKRNLADLYITPPVERFNILDFRAFPEVIEIGYRAAVQALDGWRQAPGDSRLEKSLPPQPLSRLDRVLTTLEQTLNELAA